MICANCDFGAYPELNNLIKPYITKDVGGKTIGIIGFITTDTNVSMRKPGLFIRCLWYSKTKMNKI